MDRAPGLPLPPAASTAIRSGAGSPLLPAPLPAPAPALPGLDLPLSWPRAAQAAAVALVAVAAVLLGIQAWQYLRLGARPTELQRGPNLAYRVDLNRAGRAELLQLPGIGNTLAERIEDYRKASGPFRSVDELRQVGGIGPALMTRLRPWVCVGADDAEESAPPPKSADAQPRKRLPVARKLSGKREAALKGIHIDINRASRTELQRLPGIGPKMSQRIVDERQRRPFASVDELRRVPGIGPKTLERLRPYVAVSGAPARIGKME